VRGHVLKGRYPLYCGGNRTRQLAVLVHDLRISIICHQNAAMSNRLTNKQIATSLLRVTGRNGISTLKFGQGATAEFKPDSAKNLRKFRHELKCYLVF